MKILVYGLNNAPELTGIGKYTGELCDHLAGLEDMDVRIVTAAPYYPHWKIYPGYRNRYTVERGEGRTLYRCPLYVPSSLTHPRRLLHLASFAFSSLLPLARCILWRPDRVVVVAPTLMCAPGGALVAKLCGARSLLHVQDFELDAMLAIGKRGAPSWKATLARRAERFLYRRFDAVSTISTNMVGKLRERGVTASRTVLFRNWVDTEALHPSLRNTDLLARYGIRPDAFVVLYSGNMSRKQGLEAVLDAAERLAHQPAIVFLMIGEGASREALVADARRRALSNLVFSGLVPPEELGDLLSSADLHLVVQAKGIADAVLPSKLTAILAVGGHAIVTSEEGSELETIHRQHPGIFEHAAPEDAMEIARLIECAYGRMQERIRSEGVGATPSNVVAREYAVAELERRQVLERFIDALKRL